MFTFSNIKNEYSIFFCLHRIRIRNYCYLILNSSSCTKQLLQFDIFKMVSKNNRTKYQLFCNLFGKMLKGALMNKKKLMLKTQADIDQKKSKKFRKFLGEFRIFFETKFEIWRKNFFLVIILLPRLIIISKKITTI